MPQDAFTLSYVKKELSATFVGGKISRINQPEKDWLSLLIYTRKGTVKLDANLSAKYCRLSAGEKGETPNPAVAPNFCMLLRKHLQNAEITAVEQIDFERVIYFDLNCFSEFEETKMRLYFEIMGKYSNAILVKDGIIVGALKTASLENNARRVTLGGAKYKLPEKQDKADPRNKEELAAAFARKSGDPAKFICENVTGVAYSTALDMVETYGEDITAENVYDYINGGTLSPCVVYSDGEPCDFRIRSCGGEIKAYASVLEAQAAFYGYAVNKKAFEDGKRRLTSALSSAIKKAEKRLGQTCEKLLECEKAEELKLQGELITANIYAIERGAREIEAVNYYDENCGKIRIALDPRLTPAQNAQRYFKKYAKLKRTAEYLNGQKAENEERLDYLNSIAESLSSAENRTDLQEISEELIGLALMPAPQKKKGEKKKSAEAPFRKFVFNGATVLCGRNNVQNDRLTRSLAQTDLWLHAKTFHSSHVGILTEGKQADDEVIKFAAEICAYYSAARGRDKVPVDFTLKKNVRKPKGANPGFFEYINFKTILVAPDAHAGERCDDE